MSCSGILILQRYHIHIFALMTTVASKAIPLFPLVLFVACRKFRTLFTMTALLSADALYRYQNVTIPASKHIVAC
ncbi:MAG: hypothetical protein WC819_01240 [Parcubacteria group bacterium]